MVDIIEAGKFYNDCLKEVKKQLVKGKTHGDNEIINFHYEQFDCPTKGYDVQQLVYSFNLNGTNFTDVIDIESDKGFSYIREIVAKSIVKEIVRLTI